MKTPKMPDIVAKKLKDGLNAKFRKTDIFTSRPFVATLQQWVNVLVNTLIAKRVDSRRRKPWRVSVIKKPDLYEMQNVPAWASSDHKICVNLGCDMLQGLSKENSYITICGLLAHELGHALYTNLSFVSTWLERFSEGKWYPEVPVIINPETGISEPVDLERYRSNPIIWKAFIDLAAKLQNILEDAYIENRFAADFPGELKWYLSKTRALCMDAKVKSVEEYIATQDDINVAVYILYDYLFLGTFVLNDPVSFENKGVKAFLAMQDDLDNIFTAHTMKKRLAITNRVIGYIWTCLLDDEAIDDANKLLELLNELSTSAASSGSNDPAMESSPKNGKTGGTGSSGNPTKGDRNRAAAKQAIANAQGKAGKQSSANSGGAQSGTPTQQSSGDGSAQAPSGNGKGNKQSASESGDSAQGSNTSGGNTGNNQGAEQAPNGSEDGDTSQSASAPTGDESESENAANGAGDGDSAESESTPNGEGEDDAQASGDTDESKADDASSESGEGNSPDGNEAEDANTSAGADGNSDDASDSDGHGTYNKNGNTGEKMGLTTGYDSNFMPDEQSPDDNDCSIPESIYEKNDEHEYEAVGDPAKALSDLIHKMLEEKAEKECEKELVAQLNEDAAECRTSLTGKAKCHEGVMYKVNRGPYTPDDRLEEAYRAAMEALKPISKQMQRRISQKLKENRAGGKKVGLYYGKGIYTPALMRSDDNDKIFYNNKQPAEMAEMCIGVLVDQSGSMDGNRMTAACAAAMLLYDFCTSIKIPVSIYGHNTSYYTNEYTDGIDLDAYSDFKSVDKNDRYRLMSMTAKNAANRDGAAMAYMYHMLSKRHEEAKFLFVISDGKPNGNGYSGAYAHDDMREQVRRAKTKGITTIAAAIGSDVELLDSIYGRCLDMRDLDRLPTTLVKIVVDALKKSC